MFDCILDKLRMWPWAALTAALVGGIVLIAPEQLVVAVWKAAIITGAAYLGYWLDRALFHYARPHELLEAARGLARSGDTIEAADMATLAASAMQRRAIIMAAVILGAALAV